MKVLLVNGSPNQNGCTYTALNEIKNTLNEEAVGADIYWIGKKPIGGCIACYQCAEKGKCVFDDKVNEFTTLAKDYDGFIFGSPVYYAGMNGSLMSFYGQSVFLRFAAGTASVPFQACGGSGQRKACRYDLSARSDQ